MKSIPIMLIFWYIFPIIVLFASNLLVSTLSLTDKFKIKAPDIATPILFVGLHVLSKDTFDLSVVPYYIILVLILGIILALIHADYYGDIQYRRFFKMHWRIVFLMTLILYLVMIVVSFIHYI